ncbi:putative bifunctional diguanylate cyclase/phosphodiesterase [Modicisalibacter coralii]|uniref:putative bifunctional diguanylate cyclase/phosphodiesterase n=1 Tax=Modicisalibacter coralii TaxID=2304602 RepID=UPI00100B5F9C|nr:bifunctional diguanylate cyclase/phosphodiesterase [Halomonas coralii]
MIATLRRCLGLVIFSLALVASRAAERLLRGSSPCFPRQTFSSRLYSRVNGLQANLLTWQARLQPHDVDPLTGIGTCQAALAEIDRLIERGKPFSLASMSIDNIKAINERLGHAVGDQLLVSLARRLMRLEIHRGRVYRLGGDEFLILAAPPAAGECFDERLRERLCQPLELDGTSLIPSLSLAGLRYPENGQDARRLLRRSRIALAHARQAHDGYHAYESRLDHHHERERQLLRDMVLAVREQQLRIVYQPKIRIADGSVVGFEALMQWQHPDLGLLQADEFLPLAVDSGHMALLGDWMLQHVIAQMAVWVHARHPQHVAVNLSAVDLEDAHLGQRITGWLEAHGVDPRLLMLEITEQSMMREPTLAARLLAELRDLGIRVAIDDFGTGYSSLAQLRRLPLDVLKIDKSFVLELPAQPEDALIVNASIALAHSFGLEVIAEGVETPQHLRLLAEAGCDQAQGYLISHALDADEVPAWLEAYRRRPLNALRGVN